MTAQKPTPGVFVQEHDAFPPSIVGVATAVPVFIGYTEKAPQGGPAPVRIDSLAEYQATFGGAFVHQFKLTDVTADPTQSEAALGGKLYRLDPVKRFYLYNSLRLFYDNGGESCYVVSVGTYDAPKILQADLANGLAAVNDLTGPTMLAIPEATLLYDPSPANDAGCRAIAQNMLQQCLDRQDRVALLDVWGAEALSQTPTSAQLDAVIDAFRNGVAGSAGLSYGAVYFPFLKTSLVDPTNPHDVSYANFDTAALATLRSALLTDPTAQVYIAYLDAAAKLKPGESIDPKIMQALAANMPPVVQIIYAVVAEKIGTLPPSPAMAGVYTQNDTMRGVWIAPANLALAAVTGLTVMITDAMQGDLNVPIDGLAVNAIREFAGRGMVVWGARTLDGNSNDWRYVQVRRLMIYVEQSIQQALGAFVFEPNDGPTWATVTAMINSFLQALWSQGGLMGAKPDDAFSVQCGLGSSMTAQDILDGTMIVNVQLAVVRPAEFMVLTIKQKMQPAAGG